MQPHGGSPFFAFDIFRHGLAIGGHESNFGRHGETRQLGGQVMTWQKFGGHGVGHETMRQQLQLIG